MRRSLRPTILVLAVALVLVPTIARAAQQVERRDATRLSIKHSWIGVTPPTKAALAQTVVVALPDAATELVRPDRLAGHVPPPVRRSARIVVTLPGLLRGPPASVR